MPTCHQSQAQRTGATGMKLGYTNREFDAAGVFSAQLRVIQTWVSVNRTLPSMSEVGQNAYSWSTTGDVRSWVTIGRGRLGLKIPGPSWSRFKARKHRKLVPRDYTLAFDYKAPRPMLKEMPS